MHVSDLVDIICSIIESKNNKLVLECVGPEILTFKEIIQKLLISIQKKRFLIPVPIQIASLTAKVLQLLPNPLLTEDQLKLLKYDNVSTGLYKTNFDLGFNAKKNFDEEINKTHKILCSNKTPFTFLHCVTIYPTPLNQLHLSRFNFLKKRRDYYY